MRYEFRVSEGMRSRDVLTAALAYVEAGMAVLAVWGIAEGKCACGDPKCKKPGKHPIASEFPQGFKDATTDSSIVERVFRKHPTANVAVVPDGDILVVDIDGPEGERALALGELDQTATVVTGKGRHLYYVCGGLTDWAAPTLPKVDFRFSSNGYVVAPPSTHVSGKRYRWLRVHEDAVTLSRDNLPSRRTARVDFSGERFKEGERNKRLASIAGTLRLRNLPAKAVEAALLAINPICCDPPLDEREVRRVGKSIGRYGADDEQLFGAILEREPAAMEWLWYPYIPSYGITLLAGDPGRGKSLLTALLVATVSAGKPWPLSDERAKGRRVLLMAAEDNWKRQTLPRLLKAGADIDNVHTMRKFRALTPERLDALQVEMREWKPDLVIIDTISAYMGGARDMHRQNEVGEFLGTLNDFAEEAGAAVLIVGHLNKASNEDPLHRVVGSIGFMASIRSAIFLGTDPTNPDRVAIAHGKHNPSKKGEAISFEKIGGGRDDVPMLRPVEVIDASVQDICALPRNSVGRPSTERQKAIEFVLATLGDEPMRWQTLQLRAEAAAIASEGTLNSVRAELAKERRIQQVGEAKAAKWVLAGPETGEEE